MSYYGMGDAGTDAVSFGAGLDYSSPKKAAESAAKSGGSIACGTAAATVGATGIGAPVGIALAAVTPFCGKVAAAIADAISDAVAFIFGESAAEKQHKKDLAEQGREQQRISDTLAILKKLDAEHERMAKQAVTSLQTAYTKLVPGPYGSELVRQRLQAAWAGRALGTALGGYLGGLAIQRGNLRSAASLFLGKPPPGIYVTPGTLEQPDNTARHRATMLGYGYVELKGPWQPLVLAFYHPLFVKSGGLWHVPSFAAAFEKQVSGFNLDAMTVTSFGPSAGATSTIEEARSWGDALRAAVKDEMAYIVATGAKYKGIEAGQDGAAVLRAPITLPATGITAASRAAAVAKAAKAAAAKKAAAEKAAAAKKAGSGSLGTILFLGALGAGGAYLFMRRKKRAA